MKQVFSQRYKGLLHNGDGESEDDLCGKIDSATRRRLASVVEDFREPQAYQPNRYDSWTEETDALASAIGRLSDILGYSPIMNFASDGLFPDSNEQGQIANLPTPHLFDLIELQYDELSDSPTDGREEYRKEINAAFQEDDVPWLLVDGRMVKIDARQFEQDLKRKALEQLHELKDTSPAFQSAYDELTKAVEFLKKGDYPEAITNAEKTYESVMKVICAEEGQEVSSESADKLTKRLSEGSYLALPDSLSAGGLRSNVLMSLPYLRNHAAAHGAGLDNSPIDRPLANIAVNLAAALDMYLIDEWADQQQTNEG